MIIGTPARMRKSYENGYRIRALETRNSETLLTIPKMLYHASMIDFPQRFYNQNKLRSEKSIRACHLSTLETGPDF